jgi:inorganic pyrophosphatase
MPAQTARHTILSAIGPYDAKTKDLRIVIETPKGSRNKYSYAPECDCLQLSTLLPEGMIFP